MIIFGFILWLFFLLARPTATLVITGIVIAIPIVLAIFGLIFDIDFGGSQSNKPQNHTRPQSNMTDEEFTKTTMINIYANEALDDWANNDD